MSENEEWYRLAIYVMYKSSVFLETIVLKAPLWSFLGNMQSFSLHLLFLTRTHCVSLRSNKHDELISFFIKHLQDKF